MRFEKVKAKVVWPKQKVYQRIALVKRDIAGFNRELNTISGQRKVLEQRKECVCRKLSHKWMYLRQLTEQLKESV